ncbi:MAG: hypothetical protein IJ158_13880 [Treponema sp.]|nr:hypothetical protein [Treponema sp.]
MEEKQEIDFSNVVITPLEKWVDVSLKLDETVIKYLNELAYRTNQSVDNVLAHILTDAMSEHLDISVLSAESLKRSGELNGHILLMENGEPVARLEMLKSGKKELFEEIAVVPVKDGAVPVEEKCAG